MDKYLICDDSKKTKRPILKSFDVVVTPLISSEMDKLIEHETDDVLKAQYLNMKDRIVKDPANGIWNAYWDISLKKDEKQSIGCVYFSGAPELGSVTLSFKVEQRYNWDKIVAEALRLITDWAMAQNDVYEIHTYIEISKDGYIRNIERADFVYRETEGEIEHYSMEKPATSWIGLYLIIGIAVGFILGFVFSSMIIGMAVAVIASILLGGIMDQKDAVAREKVTGQKRTPRRIIAKEKKLAMAKKVNNPDSPEEEKRSDGLEI